MKKLFFVFSLVLLLAFGLAYAAPEIKQDALEFLTPKLNSDRIAYFFGSYGVESIAIKDPSFENRRISNLYSMHGNEKIMRTLAVVEFNEPVHESLEQVHKAILQGQSIGIALREFEWKIDKLPVYFNSVALSPGLKAWMHEESADQAAIHIYKLHVYRENSKERLPYCTIIEVHSPQYLNEAWLQALYPDQYDNFRKTSPEVDALICELQSLINAMPQP